MNKVYKIKNPARAGSKWWQIIPYYPTTFGELAQNGAKVQHKKTPLGRGLNGGRLSCIARRPSANSRKTAPKFNIKKPRSGGVIRIIKWWT